MGKKPESGQFEVASAKLPESTRVEAQPMHGKWPAGERGSSSSLLKNASQRAADTPPKKSLAIRLRLGGTGKKYASDAMKNSQLALPSPLHRAARPVGSLSESRRTSADNSDETEDEGQRKSPLGPLDTSMIVRKPRSNMRREPAKHLRAAAALIGVKKPQVKRKPLPSPRKPAATGAERAPVRDETDFLYILAEAGESLERACAGNVEQPCVRKSKPSKSASQPSWKDRAKQSEAAKDAPASAPEREQSDSVKAPRSGENENTELEKKGFKFRMKQKVRQNPPTVPEAEAGDDGTTPCSDTDAKPSDDEQRLGTQLVRTGSAGLRRPDSKPTRLQPSSGRPNGLVQRLLEKAGVQTNDAKFKSGPANFNGNTSQQRRPHAVEAPTTSSRPGGERALSPVDEHPDIPLNVLAKLVDAKPSPKPSKLQNSPRMEVLPRESPRPPASPTGTNTDQESDDADSTDDEDNVADDHSHDSGIDEHELGMKRSRLPGEEGDAKKQRRIEANREAARQTIRRKRAHYEDMLAKEKELEQENSMLYMDIERARHDIELLQNNITWLQNLLDKANVEDHEGRLRIQRSLRSEQSRLEEQRCIMKARRAEELRRQEMEEKRMKEDKIRAHEEGGHLKESRGGQEQGDSEDEEEHAQEGRHRMAGDERAGARHSEDRRRPSADPRRPPNYRDLGPGGPGSNGWPMPRPGGPWMKGPGGMSPSSGPGSFPPEMAAMFAAGMPPGMMPPPGAFPGLPPGMMPPGMPTPEQMQMFSQAGGPPPPWFNIPPGAMQQQQHEMMAANEAAMHAIASGAVPDMGGMMPHGMELPPGLRGMPPEIAARMMAGFPPLPGMMPPYGMDPKQGSRPPFYGKP